MSITPPFVAVLMVQYFCHSETQVLFISASPDLSSFAARLFNEHHWLVTYMTQDLRGDAALLTKLLIGQARIALPEYSVR